VFYNKEVIVIKKKHLEGAGVTLIHIPYWWDNKDKKSIVATLNHFRPDIKCSIDAEGKKPLLVPNNKFFK